MTTLTRDEMLEIIAEEGAEVTQAAIKCLRFGFDRVQPGYGQNDLELAKEVGDVLAMADALGLDRDVIAAYRAAKMTRAVEAKRNYGRKDRSS